MTAQAHTSGVPGSPAPVIAIVNKKGGVGKTTTAVNLAATLARRAPTLLIDLDPQGSATLHLGLDPRALAAVDATAAAVLCGRRWIPGVEIKHSCGALGVVAGGPDLADAEITLTREMGGQGALREALAGLAPRIRAVVLDCPPHLGALTANALVAATHLLIPAQTEALAADGIPATLEAAAQIRARLNPGLTVFGILPTLYSAHLSQDRETLDELRAAYAGRVRLWPPVPRATAYAQAAAAGMPAAALSPRPRGLDVLDAIAAELLGDDRDAEAAHG